MRVCLFALALSIFLLSLPANKESLEPSSVSLKPPPRAFRNLTVSAKAVYVFDASENRELYALNADAQLPLASLTKVMGAITALSSIPDSTLITIRREYLEPEGDDGLFVGERFRLDELLTLTLTASSNDGIRAAAAAVGGIERGSVETQPAVEHFVRLMNKKAADLKLHQSYFINDTGLDVVQGVAGGFGSARDVARLVGHALSAYPPLFEGTRYRTIPVTSADHIVHEVKNTNEIVDEIPVLLGSKTGYTDVAGGNLVIAFDAGVGKPIIISLLGSTLPDRFTDALTLLGATFRFLEEETESMLTKRDY